MNILNISFLRAWFVRPLIRLLSWIGVGSRMLNYNSETLQVFVKISGVGSQQLTTPLLLQKHWTVQDVKAHLVKIDELLFSCWKIIFNFYRRISREPNLRNQPIVSKLFWLAGNWMIRFLYRTVILGPKLWYMLFSKKVDYVNQGFLIVL